MKSRLHPAKLATAAICMMISAAATTGCSSTERMALRRSLHPTYSNGAIQADLISSDTASAEAVVQRHARPEPGLQRASLGEAGRQSKFNDAAPAYGALNGSAEDESFAPATGETPTP